MWFLGLTLFLQLCFISSLQDLNISLPNISLDPKDAAAAGNVGLSLDGQKPIVGEASTSNLNEFAGSISGQDVAAGGIVDTKSGAKLAGGINVTNNTKVNGEINPMNGTLFNGNVTLGNLTTGENVVVSPSSFKEAGFATGNFPLNNQSLNVSKAGANLDANGPIIETAEKLLNTSITTL